MSVVSDSVVDTVKSKFDFTVDKFPLSGPDGLKTPLYGLFRSDTMDYVGKPCSKHYVAHQSDDVLALVESAGELSRVLAMFSVISAMVTTCLSLRVNLNDVPFMVLPTISFRDSS